MPTDGLSLIEQYAAIGDRRSVALVGPSGTIDWWAVPTLDAPPVLSRIVEPHGGGHFTLAPVGSYGEQRRYLPGTNVLETTYTTATGRVVVDDALNLGLFGPLPWSELARRVVGTEGEVRLGWELVPGRRFGSASPYVRRRAGHVLVDVGDQRLALCGFGAGDPTVSGRGARGEFTCRSGDTCLLALVATDGEPVPLPARDDVLGRLELTTATWRKVAGLVSYDGPWRDAVVRSVLALELLTSTAHGSIAAAATTSLPEQIGGPKNFDYRYSWVRDTSLALEALLSTGMHDVGQAAVSFLFSAIHRTAPDVHVFYRLDGGVADETTELGAAGYLNSRPVLSGNSAASQRQLGTFGYVLALACTYVGRGHVLDRPTAELCFELADRCCDEWRLEDAGFWELGQYRHYTISKMQCWAALAGAIELAAAGHLPGDHVDRWSFERDEIRRFVEERCFSERLSSYRFYADADELDASVLLAGRLGYDTGSRLEATADACRRKLGRGPRLYRYSGMPEEEGTFVACSFWLVDALWRVGRREEATALMNDALELTSEVGLLSEQQDPKTGRFLGNVPQALSHLALVNAALLVSSA